MADETSTGLPWVLMQVAMQNSFGGLNWVKSSVLVSVFLFPAETIILVLAYKDHLGDPEIK